MVGDITPFQCARILHSESKMKVNGQSVFQAVVESRIIMIMSQPNLVVAAWKLNAIYTDKDSVRSKAFKI